MLYNVLLISFNVTVSGIENAESTKNATYTSSLQLQSFASRSSSSSFSVHFHSVQ